jgi:hypothetical protein
MGAGRPAGDRPLPSGAFVVSPGHASPAARYGGTSAQILRDMRLIISGVDPVPFLAPVAFRPAFLIEAVQEDVIAGCPKR